jgi:signal transduction histidine kinase
VWTNLISNAIKYTPENGSIAILLCQQDKEVLGQVKDTGIGIPEEAKASLFTEFFRAKNAKDLNLPGTGLGLAIVKQIIENAGGRIWVESEVGKGSTFSFVLPVIEGVKI